MSSSEERIREQLVDYLYGELDGAQLDEFEAELAASPALRAELEALRATLRTARSGLAALHEEPPAHVRAVILAAEQATRAPRRAVSKPWYRRTSTLVPTLAAAAAVAFAVLAPRRDHQLDRRVEHEAASSPPAEGTPTPAVAPEPPAAPLKDEPSSLGGGPRDEARPPPPRPTAERRVPRPKATRQRAADEETRLEYNKGAKRERELDDLARGGSGFAQPPAGYAPVRAAPAEEAAAPEAERAAEKKTVSAERPAAAPASSAPAQVQEGAREDAAPSRAPDALVARAKEHADARRWADAAIAYRELLQRFPKDPRAASWRSELSRVARELSALPLTP